MQRQLELLIITFGELPDDTWKQEVAKAESRLRERVASYEGSIRFNADVTSKNIGRGADWTVLALCFAGAAFVIPELHKKVRENLEEWRRIYQELYSFFSWILEKRKALYPDEFVFLKAIEILSEQSLMEGMEFKGMSRLPESDPDLQGRESLVFSFGDTSRLVQVAISRSGEVLWQNVVEL